MGPACSVGLPRCRPQFPRPVLTVRMHRADALLPAPGTHMLASAGRSGFNDNGWRGWDFGLGLLLALLACHLRQPCTLPRAALYSRLKQGDGGGAFEFWWQS